MEFFKLQDEEKKEFFNIPKLFYNSESIFFKLSLCSKLIYPLLLDLNKKSIENKISDKDNRVYIPITLTDLSNKLNCDNDLIYSSLIELQSYTLLKLFKSKNQTTLYIYLYNIKFEECNNQPILSNIDFSKYDKRTSYFLHLHNSLFPYKLNQLNADYLANYISVCEDDFLKKLFENQSSFTNSFNGLKCAIERYKKENIFTKDDLEKSISTHKFKIKNKSIDSDCGKFNAKVTNFRYKNYDYEKLENELLGWDD